MENILIPIVGGFTLGFLGSLHCIGMCGPIVLALYSSEGRTVASLLNRLLYNFGRVVTYAIFGLIFGFIGEKISLFSYQQYFSILFGVLIILALIIPSSIKTKLSLFPHLSKFLSLLKEKMSNLIGRKSSGSNFLIGILNGFLPCGFVYIAITGAIVTGSIVSGIIFMTMFGIGTIPALFIFSIIPSLVTIKKQIQIKKLIPVFSFIIAILFILRGLNLGIPFISPKAMEQNNHIEKVGGCCGEEEE